MKKILNTTITVILLLTVCTDLYSQEKQNKQAEKISWFHGSINAGSEAWFWSPKFKEPGNEEKYDIEQLVDYDTEGLALFSINGSFNLYKFRTFKVSYTRPFESTPKQTEMFRVNKTKKTSFNKIYFHLTFYFLAYFIDIDKSYLNLLYSTWYRIQQILFFGNAIPLESFTYIVAKGNSMDIEKGINLNFKTQFTLSDISVNALSYFDAPDFVWFRLGYYWMNWDRPYNYMNLEYGEPEPLLRESRFKSNGFYVDFGHTAISVYYRYGINSSIIDLTPNPIDLNDLKLEYNSKGLRLAFPISPKYLSRELPKLPDNVKWIVGLEVERWEWKATEIKSENISTDIVSAENLGKIFTKIEISF